MNDPEAQVPVLAGLLSLFVAFAAIAAFVMWIRRWSRLGYMLAYEPRRRTPWGPLAGVLAVLMTGLGVWNVLMLRTTQGAAPQWTADEFARAQLTMSVVQLGFAIAIVAVLVFVNGASWRDFGLPTSSDQAMYDIMLGFWIAFAAMVPLWLLQVAGIMLLGIEPGHPLLDQMQQTPNLLLFAAAMVTAVLAAPIFEELVFRLLLQGGLERLEDEMVGWKYSLPPLKEQVLLTDLDSESTVQPAATDASYEEAPLEDIPLQPDTDVLHRSVGPQRAAGEELWVDRLEPEDLPKLPPCGESIAPGLNHGWTPILISSFLFALAHLGNGPSPIPLFALALMMGYAYQRTHRILPCIVAHMVINAVSVGILILMLSQAGAPEQ
ncbi:CPBP family intramembrane metalloprotease [Aeoliella sp. ICT_H6.2]|uniref:CPBP family intramembrane metalloprotease n=1 Tax=Aeoliella straminimaris TaxID=2954799 RepID=A0A9X2FDZ9_9BACT|nr:CPBP family intramembrane glutamic endopeptidase [Aeoliella straminimaris]MCO6044599.1 CPBP family intramembrane metalloprotease [Aeoliella straminimaris]